MHVLPALSLSLSPFHCSHSPPLFLNRKSNNSLKDSWFLVFDSQFHFIQSTAFTVALFIDFLEDLRGVLYDIFDSLIHLFCSLHVLVISGIKESI